MTDNGKDGEVEPLPPEDEVAHYRETFRRWTERTKKDARYEIDRLKAMVAAYTPQDKDRRGFHQAFSAVFDDWCKIEVEEIRERRNVELHKRAAEAYEPYRESNPELVKSLEEMLDKPPYNLPAKTAP